MFSAAFSPDIEGVGEAVAAWPGHQEHPWVKRDILGCMEGSGLGAAPAPQHPLRAAGPSGG